MTLPLISQRKRLRTAQHRLLASGADRIDIIVEARSASGQERIARRLVEPDELDQLDPGEVLTGLVETAAAALDRAAAGWP